MPIITTSMLACSIASCFAHTSGAGCPSVNRISTRATPCGEPANNSTASSSAAATFFGPPTNSVVPTSACVSGTVFASLAAKVSNTSLSAAKRTTPKRDFSGTDEPIISAAHVDCVFSPSSPLDELASSATTRSRITVLLHTQWPSPKPRRPMITHSSHTHCGCKSQTWRDAWSKQYVRFALGLGVSCATSTPAATPANSASHATCLCISLALPLACFLGVFPSSQLLSKRQTKQN